MKQGLHQKGASGDGVLYRKVVGSAPVQEQPSAARDLLIGKPEFQRDGIIRKQGEDSTDVGVGRRQDASQGPAGPFHLRLGHMAQAQAQIPLALPVEAAAPDHATRQVPKGHQLMAQRRPIGQVQVV